MLPQHPPRRDHAHPSPPPSPAYNTRHPPFPFPPPPFPHLMPPPFPPPSMPPPFPPPNMPPPYWEPPRSPYARSHCSERDDRDYYRPYDSHRDDRYPPRDHSREPYYPRDRSQPPYTPRRLHYDEKYNSNYSSPREPIYSPPLPYPPPHDHSVSPPPRLHPPPIHPLKSNRSNRSSARLSYDYAGTRVYGDASHPSNHLPSQEDVIHGTDRHFGNHPRRKTPDPPQKTDHPPYPLDYRSKKHQNKPPPKNQPKKPLPVKRPAKPVPKPKDHVQPPEAPAPAAAAPAPAATPANGQPQQVSDIVADIVKNMQINSASPAPATQSSPPVAQPAPPQQPVTVSPPEQPSAAPHSSVSDKHTPTSTNSPAVVELPPACCDVKTSHPPAPASSSASAKSSEWPMHRLEFVDPGVASVTQSAKQTPPTILVAPNASKSHGSSNRDHSSSRNDADTIEVTIGNTSASHTYHPPGNDPAVDIIWKKASKRLEIVDPEEMKPSAAPVASPECSPAAPQPSTSDSNSATISSSVGTPRANTSVDMTNGTPGHTMAPVANRNNHISHITKSESHAGTSADRLYPAASKSVGSNDPSKAHISGSQASRSIHAILDVTESSPELRQKPRPSMKYANGGASTDALDTSEVIDFSTGNAADDGAGAPGLCNEVLDAVVKIYATHCDPNYSLPWQMRRQTQSTSSGFVISGRRILTNAHSVEHHTVVRVKKRASDEKYIARVLATGNECDLALLTVIDEEFWQDLNPLQFGPLPELQASVIVIGYPIGGENISVTAGVVSRVEIQDYTHGASQLLGIQIDAAINSGSSGGPALNHRNEVVGIAFQSLNTGDSENIGYLVAESVVDHFLKDYERNKRYTGFCHCGFLWQRMENISLRRSMKMKDEENGILVRRVNKQSRALKVLREGDIVSHIDGIPISNAGTVPYRSGERISFHYIITTKFTGDPVKLNIIRNGEKMEIEYALGESSENLLVPVHEQRRQPEYLVVAGLVFVALSEPYLADEYGDKWDLKAPVRLLERLMYGSKETADEQVVVLSQVLNAEINIGYEYVINTRVHKFNGVKLRNLAQLAKLVETCEDDYLRFDLDDEIVVVGREEAIKSSKEIMKTHCIPSAYSIGDLPLHGIENGVLEEVEGLTSMGDNASENGLTQQNTGLSGDGLLPNGV